MAGKDPRQMKTAEVAKMARKKGIQDIEHMNKSQMLEAMGQSQSGRGQPAQPGGSGRKGGNR
jgi:hypothetical protein